MSADPIALVTLRELQRRGMTISDLAARTGVDRSVLGRWLSGVRTIRVRHAVLVMQALGIVVVAERDLRGQTPTPQHHRQHRPQPP